MFNLNFFQQDIHHIIRSWRVYVRSYHRCRTVLIKQSSAISTKVHLKSLNFHELEATRMIVNCFRNTHFFDCYFILKYNGNRLIVFLTI